MAHKKGHKGGKNGCKDKAGDFSITEEKHDNYLGKNVVLEI